MDGLQLAFFLANAGFGLLSGGATVLVLVASRRRSVDLALAYLLATTSVNFLAPCVFLATDEPFLVANAVVYQLLSAILAPFAYLMLLGLAVDSPLVSWLRPRPIQLALLAAGPALCAWVALAPGPLLVSPTTGLLELSRSYAPMAAVILLPLSWVAVTAATLGVIAAIHAWRRAPEGSLRRRRAKSYVLAFLFNDAAFITGFVSVVAVVRAGPSEMLGFLISPLFGILFVPLLVRALLRDQLFDFDLKLKLNVKRGTVAGVFLGVFFVVAQVAQNYLANYGWLAGGAVAGLLLFALAPIQRAAERVASAAVPGAVDSPEYRLVKKREVYRAAVEGALEDGEVTDKERTVLARLADQLGLTASEALDVEREAKAALAPSA